MGKHNEALSNRWRVAPHVSREGFVHERDIRSLAGVTPRDIAALEKPGAGSLEIARGNRESVWRQDRVVKRELCRPWRKNRNTAQPAVEGNSAHRPCRRYSRNSSQGVHR